MTCPEDWEIRQPQDFVRGKADIQAPKWTKPEVQDLFVDGIACSTRTSLAGYSIAGCMIAGNIVDPWAVPPSTFTEP